MQTLETEIELELPVKVRYKYSPGAPAGNRTMANPMGDPPEPDEADIHAVFIEVPRSVVELALIKHAHQKEIPIDIMGILQDADLDLLTDEALEDGPRSIRDEREAIKEARADAQRDEARGL